MNIKLEKCKNSAGYAMLQKIFTNIAESREINEPLQKLPAEYDNRVFRELNYGPVDGKFGYLVFKNESKYPLE